MCIKALTLPQILFETRSALCITRLTSDQKGTRKFCCDYLHIRLEVVLAWQRPEPDELFIAIVTSKHYYHA